MVMFDKLQLKNVHVIINKVDFSLTFHMTMNNFDIIWSQQYWAWMMDLQISINLTKTCKHTTSQQLVHVLCPLSFSSAEYLQTSCRNKVKNNLLNYYQNFSSSVTNRIICISNPMRNSLEKKLHLVYEWLTGRRHGIGVRRNA